MALINNSIDRRKKMKDRHFRFAIVVMVVLGLLIGTSTIASEKVPAGEQTIQGKVEKGEKGMPLIKMDDGQVFNILGQNMTAMIGKTVKVTGTVSKGKTTRSIVVSNFEEVQE
jgi:hypothetical protein